jgi:selenide,water dikinase
VNYADLPLLARAGEFVEAGLMTGASGRNWASYGDRVSWRRPRQFRADLALRSADLGGLLVSCAPDAVTEVLSLFLQHGFTHVSVIGEMAEGEPGIAVV